VGRAVAPVVLPGRSEAAGEESPSRTGHGGGQRPPGATRGKVPQKRHSRWSRFFGIQAMVKWCGKSAPRPRRRCRQGKPHRLQDQVAGHSARVGAVELPLGQRVGCLPKGRANWQQWVKINGRRPPLPAGYRTRLTDPLFLMDYSISYPRTRPSGF